MKNYSRDTVNTMIQELKVSNSELPSFLKELSSDGSTVEGYNDGSKGSINEPSALSELGTNIKKDVSSRLSNIKQGLKEVPQAYNQEANAGVNDSKVAGVFGAGAKVLQQPLNIAGNIAGAGWDILGNAVSSIIPDSIKQQGEEAVKSFVQNNEGLQKFMSDISVMQQENPDLFRAAENVLNIAPTGEAKKIAGEGVNILEKAGKNVIADTKNIIGKTGESIKGIKTPDLFPVDAPENIKTSLNPFLTNTKAEISVPTKDGFILKTIDKVTPSEKQAVQKQTSNLYNTMLKRAEEFKVDRRDILSPLEVVGQNTDKALSKVDKLRQNAGKVMGEIEKLNTDTPIELKGTRLNTFIDEYLGSNKKYGRTFKDTSFLNDFVKDFDKLSQNPTAKETLDFTRTWTNELENLKDGFGQFKDNKRTYTLIEGALGDIKNNTRNFIAEANPEYKNALAQYRLTSQIKEEGNRLLGKEGLSGERIKGGALAKRAVQSSSDAGARQFYNTLKQTVGYDGLKEADIALQAMKDAGDYQGLSLLEVNKDLYNATVGNIVKKIPGGEAVSETAKVVSSKMYPQSKRINKLIQNAGKVTQDLPINLGSKTQSQADINLQNTLKSKVNIPENSLILEAKKYKSAEEFVKAQEDKLYIHGTQKKIEGKLELKSKASGVQTPEKDAVDVLYVTPNTETGKMHSRMYTKQNGVTYAIKLKPEAKIFDYTNPSHRKMIEKTMTESQKKLVNDNLVDGQLSWMATPPVKNVKKLGFDGMKQIERKAGEDAYSATFGDAKYSENAESLMLFNKNVFEQVDTVKTKSQLTDIWNKANKKVTLPKSKDLSTELVQQAKKYKSAEEFVKAQGETVYHGGDLVYNEFDFSKSGKNLPAYKTNNQIITTTTDIPLAKHYGANLTEAYIDPTKIKEFDRLPLGGSQLDKYIEQARKEGYSAISSKQSIAGASDLENGVPVITVFDKSAIKTKSQLIDIWNKANKK